MLKFICLNSSALCFPKKKKKVWKTMLTKQGVLVELFFFLFSFFFQIWVPCFKLNLSFEKMIYIYIYIFFFLFFNSILAWPTLEYNIYLSFEETELGLTCLSNKRLFDKAISKSNFKKNLYYQVLIKIVS